MISGNSGATTDATDFRTPRGMLSGPVPMLVYNVLLKSAQSSFEIAYSSSCLETQVCSVQSGGGKSYDELGVANDTVMKCLLNSFASVAES